MVVLLPHTAGRHASSWSWYIYSVRSRVDLLTRSIYISHVLRCEGREHIYKQDLGDLYIIRAPLVRDAGLRQPGAAIDEVVHSKLGRLGRLFYVVEASPVDAPAHDGSRTLVLELGEEDSARGSDVIVPGQPPCP